MPARGLNWLTMGISVASRGTTDSEGERVQAHWELLAEQLLQKRSSSEQSAKAALEWLAEREGKTLAQLIREAVDRYLQEERELTDAEVEEILRSTFGIAPDFEVPPRSEWDRNVWGDA